jgi:hypothetical protein
LLLIEEVAMPSVLGLMERLEARARQDLESWTEVLEQAQAEVNAARERVERARVGRAWSSRSGRFSGQRGASPAIWRNSLIVAAHHTICWW